MSDHRIIDVRARPIGFARTPTTLQAHLVSPLNAFPARDTGGRSPFGECAQVIVEVETDTGLTGIGTAGGFSAVPATVITEHLRRQMIGADPFNVERNWNVMYRTIARLGVSVGTMAGISGIDIACYDLMGKALGVPVHDLIGGRKEERTPVYASRLYALDDLDELAEEARRWRDAGFGLVKQRFGFAPRDGVRGMQRNVELVRTVREAIGDDVELAVDAYMGWDLPYAIEMVRRLAPFDIKWLEEPLMPHDVAGYRQLCRTSPIPISHGEHQVGRWAFARLIEEEAADLLQPDVNRVGGITEARRIFALAAVRDLPVIPHSNELHNLHLVVSQENAPMAEYFPEVEPDTGNELFWKIFTGAPVAEDGFVTLGSEPGLGLGVNERAVEELMVGA